MLINASQKTRIFLVYTVTLLSLAFSNTWNVKETGVTIDFRDVFFIDSLNGWIVGDSSLVLNTEDGGVTWNSHTISNDTTILNKVFFVNRETGYIVGYDGLIYSTKNGGDTWVKNDSGVDYGLWDIQFINADTGWIVGGDFYKTGKYGVILVTHNGGNIWHKQLETYSESYFNSELFTSVHFTDSINGWALAGDYVDNFSHTQIYRTFNGLEWQKIGQIPNSIWTLNIFSEDTLWAGGFGLFKSFDGGINWVSGNSGSIISDIILFNNARAYFVAGKSIKSTNDSGYTWEREYELQDDIPLNSITSSGEQNMWVVGDVGILLKKDRSSTSVNNFSPKFEYAVSQNYPNPFNASTKLTLKIDKSVFTSIKVIDVTGKIIRYITSKTFNPGSYTILWDAKNSNGDEVVSGIYYIIFRFGQHIISKKVVLIK